MSLLVFPYSVWFREKVAISNQPSYVFGIFSLWLYPFGNLFFKLIDFNNSENIFI